MKTKQDIQEFVDNMDDNQIQFLLMTLVEKDRAFIPQWYLPEHTKYYGFKNIKGMKYANQDVYEQIDELVNHRKLFLGLLADSE